ncbi:MAG: carbohydrate ABC transporter permease [Oscillospiraceae bacterium]|jgi:multiple sugar transport system permease protein|nr:carbohydrate ABC transporter permease [Oscillospiraceae bacterium]
MHGATARNTRGRIISDAKSWALSLLRWALIVGVSYVIVSPLIGMAARSFFSNSDQFNPMVYLIPQTPTLERYQVALKVMGYADVLPRNLLFVGGLAVIQAFVCSMVGYGFARFNFPLKRVLFGCLIVMIVLPSHVIMLPLYMLFQRFDPLGLFALMGMEPPNMLASPWPMYIMTAFGAGLRSGLYIYIFTQFFRGLPKEIEEAAEIDGAGAFYTYLRVMLPNAAPSALTVLIFSVVWQFNDKFYAQLFSISPRIALSKQISGLQASVSNLYQLRDPSLTTLYLYAGVMLTIVPLLVLYIILQRRFIEGVERSGIVG